MESCPNSHGELVYHISEVKYNKDSVAVDKYNLCLQCGMKKFPQIGLPPLIIQNTKSKPEKCCPKCKQTAEDIKKEAKLGCPFCYEFFSDSLEAVLINCHDLDNRTSIDHKGKQPKYKNAEKIKCAQSENSEETIKDIKGQIISLQNKIKKAIEIENYEVAAVLTSKIKELQDKLSTL